MGGAIAALAFIALLTGIARHSQRMLEAGLPPRVVCASQSEATTAALRQIVEHGGGLVGVLGTGSMAPYIPAAARDPKKTIVGYLVTAERGRFEDIRRGNLVIYEYAPEPGSNYVHGAAEKTADGWIMSGLHNARSESWTRVTSKNFKGIVTHTFVWPQ